MAKSEFAKWFDAQFGKCPMSHDKALKLQDDIAGMEMELSSMKQALREYGQWQSDYRAALYTRTYVERTLRKEP